MKTYARIQDGKVVEIIAPMAIDGNEVPIEERFHPDFVATLVDVTGIDPTPNEGDNYVGGKFSTPAGPSLAVIQSGAIRQIDADVDAIYGAVIGNRQAEYDLAESDANAYKSAGYSGAVPASVQAWATAKKQTAKWAADDILATSANWRAAQADIRANRLVRKEDVRNAGNPAGVATALSTWSAYVAQARSALGI